MEIDILTILDNWIDNNKIIEKSIKFATFYFEEDNFLEKEFGINEKLNFKLYRKEYIILEDSDLSINPYKYINIIFYVLNNNNLLCYYQVTFDLDGNCIDDKILHKEKYKLN